MLSNIRYELRRLGPLLRALLSTLSILGLIKHGKFAMPESVGSFVDAYDQAMNYLVTENLPFWSVSATELLRQMWLHFTGESLTLLPHWKHVLVLMGIYFFKQASDVATMVLRGTHQRWAGRTTQYSYYVLGAVSAILTCAAAGGIALDDDEFAAAKILGFTIAGVLLYDLLTSFFGAFTLRLWLSVAKKDWTTWFADNAFESIKRAAVGVFLSLMLLLLAQMLDISKPAVPILLILVLLLGTYWVFKAKKFSMAELQDSKAHYGYYKSSLGVEMLSSFVAPALIFLNVFFNIVR